MLIGDIFVWPIESEMPPIANSGHEFDAEEISQTKDSFRLAMGISVKHIWLKRRLIFEQSVQDIDCLPSPTSNKVTEEGDIGI